MLIPACLTRCATIFITKAAMPRRNWPCLANERTIEGKTPVAIALTGPDIAILERYWKRGSH
jgi:hypothetical protein